MTNGRRPRSARLRAHIRGNLVGYVALFLALNLGTAWALERNSVTSKHIAKGQVKAADLAANAVNGKTVEDGSLTSADLDDSALAAGPTGPPGPEGPPGADGAPGEAGPAGSPDTPQQVLDKLKSVDGPGSGLDADTLDGRGSSSFGPGIMAARFTAIADGQNRFPIGDSTTATGPLPSAPVTSVISNFRVGVGTPPAPGTSWTFTVREDGTLTNVGCTVPAGNAGCTDGSDSVVIEAGHLYSINVKASSGSPTSTSTVVDYLMRSP